MPDSFDRSTRLALGMAFLVGMAALFAWGVSLLSDGCIRLHPDDARWFTQWRPGGKPIIILPLTKENEAPG